MAESSVGSERMDDGLEIFQCAERVILYRRQKKEIEQRMEEIVEADYPNLLTISGVGAVTVGGIIGEIGNVENCHGSDSIVVMAGLNPKVYESGKEKMGHTRISKIGSPYLRNALFTAAKCMYMHKVKVIHDFVGKKLAEGKKMTCALDHAARKFANIFYTLAKTKQDFVEHSST